MIVPEHEFPFKTSLTRVTVGIAVQLSASSVMEFMSWIGTSAKHCKTKSAGAVPVGLTKSLIVINSETLDAQLFKNEFVLGEKV